MFVSLLILCVMVCLVGSWLLRSRMQARQRQQALEQVRARAHARRQAREHEYRNDRDMLFDSERPIRLGEQEHGIIVRVLDGFDAEVSN